MHMFLFENSMSNILNIINSHTLTDLYIFNIYLIKIRVFDFFLEKWTIFNSVLILRTI